MRSPNLGATLPRAILDTLLAMDFHAFIATEDGFLVFAPLLERYELLNLIAVPNEQLDEVNPLVKVKGR